MNTKRLSKTGLVDHLRGIVRLIDQTIDDGDKDAMRDLLDALVAPIEILAQDDFFGTEGWKEAAGL